MVASCVGTCGVIVSVAAEFVSRPDGRPDRKVTVTRECGHSYFWSGPVDAPLPRAGEPSMVCLGPADARYERPADAPEQPTIFDGRKRPVRKRLPRRGELEAKEARQLTAF